MPVVSSKEFAAHQKKYYDMAVKEDVFIKRGRNTFHLHRTDVDETEYHEPDEDFYRSLTKDELLSGIYEDVDKFFAAK